MTTTVETYSERFDSSMKKLDKYSSLTGNLPMSLTLDVMDLRGNSSRYRTPRIFGPTPPKRLSSVFLPVGQDLLALSNQPIKGTVTELVNTTVDTSNSGELKSTWEKIQWMVERTLHRLVLSEDHHGTCGSVEPN